VAENAGTAATLAGGAYGYMDGAYASAQFRSPRGMAIDVTGQLFVADTGNRAVRRLALDGTVSTLAGGPEQAQIQEPHGLAVNAAGQVFVSDTARHAIYRIAPDGTVTLLAGGTQPGYADGTGAQAQFDDPRGLALDAAGNLFVADMNNHCIRKVTPTGEVTTFAGSVTMGAADGTGPAATFTSPIALAFGAGGDLFVADIVTHSLRKITPSGVVTTFAGGASGDADGLGTAARFAHPWAIASDARGTLYVVDGEQASRIRRIGTDAQVSTLAGGATPGYQNGAGAQARFFSAFALTASSCGRLYLTDGFCRVREVR
jgi:streptogramin lyase